MGSSHSLRSPQTKVRGWSGATRRGSSGRSFTVTFMTPRKLKPGATSVVLCYVFLS